MGAARRVIPAPWTRPGTPRVTGHPSWMGIKRVAPGEPASSSQAPSQRPPPESSRARQVAADARSSVVPPSVPPVVVPLARASVPPGVATIIQFGLELELADEVDTLREEIARLALELGSVRARILEDCEPEIVRLALTVATRVVGRELAADPSLVVGWIREGLTALPGREAPVVAVAPDIAAALPLESALADLGAPNVVVDASLRPGSCELREASSLVAVGAEERLAAVADALGVERERSQ